MGKADLHIHTKHSDGSAAVGEILEQAAAAGLDTIAITDHNEVAGAFEGAELARNRNIPVRVVIGEEISSSDGHLVGLFLKHRIRPMLTAEATIEEIHRQGGLAVAVHPFSLWLRLFRCGGVGSKMEWLQLDAVEAVNGSLMEGGIQLVHQPVQQGQDPAVGAWGLRRPHSRGGGPGLHAVSGSWAGYAPPGHLP